MSSIINTFDTLSRTFGKSVDELAPPLDQNIYRYALGMAPALYFFALDLI